MKTYKELLEGKEVDSITVDKKDVKAAQDLFKIEKIKFKFNKKTLEFEFQKSKDWEAANDILHDNGISFDWPK